MKYVLKIVVFWTILSQTFDATAQNESPGLDNRINLLFGLNQPLLAGGFNVEGNLFYKRLAFDYSHGVSLDFAGNTVTGELAEQQLAVHMPYTTGFGVGYRFNEWFNLRVEPKWHRFEIYQAGVAQTASNQIVGYNTFSLGLGAYVNWRPFKEQDNALRGLMVSPSLRYWPRVRSTLNNDQFTYTNTLTDQVETHNAMEAGIANTPIIFNISVGYSFQLKK